MKTCAHGRKAALLRADARVLQIVLARLLLRDVAEHRNAAMQRSEDFRSQHDLCSEGRVEGEWPTAMVDDDWLESWAQTSQRGSLPKFGHDTDFGWFRMVSDGFGWFRMVSDGFGWFRMVLVHAGASPRLCLLLGDGRFQVLEVGAAMDAFQRLHCPCVGQGDAGRKKTQCNVMWTSSLLA